MTWTKLDDGFWSRPKVDRASLAAVGAFTRSLSYCGHHNTDGHIPPAVARYVTQGKQAIVRELLSAGFWEENDSGYLVPDYLDFNPSRAEVEERRARDAERQRRHRGESRRDS